MSSLFIIAALHVGVVFLSAYEPHDRADFEFVTH